MSGRCWGRCCGVGDGVVEGGVEGEASGEGAELLARRTEVIGAIDGEVIFPGLERFSSELGVVGEGVGKRQRECAFGGKRGAATGGAGDREWVAVGEGGGGIGSGSIGLDWSDEGLVDRLGPGRTGA